MRRALRISGWVLLFCTALVFAGTCMSTGVFAGYVAAGIGLVVLLIALAVVNFACVTLPKDFGQSRKRADLCPRCRYTLPAHGRQLCPECGTTTDEHERRPNRSAMESFCTWLNKAAIICLGALPIAGVLTAVEWSLTWYLGSRAFQNYQHLTFSKVPASHCNDGWVIPAYTGASVTGGWVYEDSEMSGIRPEIFRPTRWTPWLHMADLFYVQDQPGKGRVFYYFD